MQASTGYFGVGGSTWLLQGYTYPSILLCHVCQLSNCRIYHPGKLDGECLWCSGGLFPTGYPTQWFIALVHSDFCVVFLALPVFFSSTSNVVELLCALSDGV